MPSVAPSARAVSRALLQVDLPARPPPERDVAVVTCWSLVAEVGLQPARNLRFSLDTGKPIRRQRPGPRPEGHPLLSPTDEKSLVYWPRNLRKSCSHARPSAVWIRTSSPI